MRGRPLQIIKNNDNNLECIERLLIETLMTDEIKDRYVCVISIAGAFRKGKSFMLNFFLRYMYLKYGYGDVNDFLSDENQQLSGFSWCHGTDPVTSGVYMWSDVFLHDFENGDKIAIILLDTQGLFDHQSTVQNCASIFALSTMISSVQIYNISENIDESDLQYLELFTQYGKLAFNSSDKKLFQHLMFLIRDWPNTIDYEFGKDGGNYYLKDVLKTNKAKPELNALRENIKANFTKLWCFLMPHPGMDVASQPNFRGCLKQIKADFKKYLLKLVPLLLLPENLLIKEINGEKVRAKDWANYFRGYAEIFKNPNLPEPQTVFIATAKVSNQTHAEESRNFYNNLMNELCAAQNSHIPDEALLSHHMDCRRKAFDFFDSKPKLGNEELIQSYQNQLDNYIETDFNRIRIINNGKMSESETAILENINEAANEYWALLNDRFGEHKDYAEPDVLQNFHLEHTKEIFTTFSGIREEHIAKLHQNLNDKLNDIIKLNHGKLCEMEVNAFTLVQSVQNSYLVEMEHLSKRYVKNFHEVHMDIKEAAICQYNDVCHKLTVQQSRWCRQAFEKFFGDRNQYFQIRNRDNFEYLRVIIHNKALLARRMFIDLLTNEPALTQEKSDEFSNGLLMEFDLHCQDLNSDLWEINRKELVDDMKTTSDYVLSNVNQIQRLSEQDQLEFWVQLAEMFGHIALGGSSKLAEFGVGVLKAAGAVKAAMNVYKN